MRLREAMILSIRNDAQLAKADRPDVLNIDTTDGVRFVSSNFRAKYQANTEVKLSARDCLSEDWILWKNGKEFMPND